MSKQKFEVIRAWAGVELGDVIDLDPAKIHPAIKANIRPVTKAKAKGDDGAAAAAEAASIVNAAGEQAEKLLTEAKEAATKAAEKLIADAKVEAEQIVKEARTAADKVLTDAYAEIEAEKTKAKGK